MNLPGGHFDAARATRVVLGLVVCNLVLALPACQIPKLRLGQTKVTLPPDYNGVANPENSAQLRVDEFYNDPVLLSLICQAMATNRDLKVLEEEIQVARSLILSRAGAFLPLAGFRAGGGWDRNSAFTPTGAAERQLEYLPGRHFPATPGDSMLGFNFLLPLDIWRELRNARDAAIQRYYAAIERRNYFVTRMVADIAENYFTLMALDQRLVNLDQIIAFQQKSLGVAEAQLAAGRTSELPVQRFRAEVFRNQSEKLIVRQDIVETENRINFLAGRVPQGVDRNSANFYDLTLHPLCVGVPAQLLLNRPDIRQAERDLAAAGLDVLVARARFFPRVDINGFIGYQAFNPRYLFNPEALVFNAAGELAVPVLNRAAIRADYLAANAMQLESVYNYQRVVLNAVTEVVNRLAAVENYSRSITLKRQQLQALEAAVTAATQLWQLPREKSQVDYLDVLTSQRDLLEGRMVLIDTKRRQLTAVVNVYQALGGGSVIACPPPAAAIPPVPPDAPQPLPPPREVKNAPEPLPAPAEMKEPPPGPPEPKEPPPPAPVEFKNPPPPPQLIEIPPPPPAARKEDEGS